MDDLQNSTPMTLGDEIREILIQFLKSKPRLKATGLSSKNIGKTTLHKIAKGKSTSPTAKSIAGVLLEINKGKSWNEIIDLYKAYPKVYSTVKEYVGKHYKGTSQNVHTTNGFENALKNKELFRAMIMTQDDYGADRKVIEALFGHEVLKSVDKLITSGDLTERNGRVFSLNQKINGSQETVQAFAINLLKKSYNIEDFGTGINNELRIEYRTNVNKEFLMPKVSDLIIKLQRDISKMMDDPKAHGRDTVWAVMAMDSLFKFNPEALLKKETIQ